MSVKVEVGVVSPVEGFLMCDSAEGEAERAGGKKTCQNEMAVERSERSDARRDQNYQLRFPAICSSRKQRPTAIQSQYPSSRLQTHDKGVIVYLFKILWVLV